MDMIRELGIDELFKSPAIENLRNTLNMIAFVQKNLLALAASGDTRQLDLLKIGSTIQLFLIDTLASGKRPNELNKDDWKSIAEQVSKYAVLEEGQRYSEFVFSLYADYIELSVKKLRWTEERFGIVSDCERLDAIQQLADEIRADGEALRADDQEAAYIEKCLWLSLEGMVKLLCYWLTSKLSIVAGAEYGKLIQAASDLAFEYGRYVLYAKEKAILEAYIQNQYLLDEELRAQYEEFLAELNRNAEQFHELIDAAFSPDIHDSLLQSAALARAVGVKEEELLKSIEDIDSFFMD